MVVTIETTAPKRRSRKTPFWSTLDTLIFLLFSNLCCLGSCAAVATLKQMLANNCYETFDRSVFFDLGPRTRRRASVCKRQIKQPTSLVFRDGKGHSLFCLLLPRSALHWQCFLRMLFSAVKCRPFDSFWLCKCQWMKTDRFVILWLLSYKFKHTRFFVFFFSETPLRRCSSIDPWVAVLFFGFSSIFSVVFVWWVDVDVLLLSYI